MAAKLFVYPFLFLILLVSLPGLSQNTVQKKQKTSPIKNVLTTPTRKLPLYKNTNPVKDKKIKQTPLKTTTPNPTPKKDQVPATKTTVNKKQPPTQSKTTKPDVKTNKTPSTKPLPQKAKTKTQNIPKKTTATPTLTNNKVAKSKLPDKTTKGATKTETPSTKLLEPKQTRKIELKEALKDSTFYKVIHYRIPDSTKIFFNQMVHYKNRDSTYYRETDFYELFLRTFESKKNPNAPAKPKKKRKIYWSFFPSGDPADKTALVTATNVAFHLGPEKNTKLTSFSFLAFTNFYNKFAFPIHGNIWTKGNKLNLTGDYNYFYTPHQIYGLGASTENSDRYSINYSYIKLHQTVLRKVRENIFAGMGYALDYRMGIIDNNPETKGGKSFRDYNEGEIGSSVSSGVTFIGLFDDRQNSINPQKGNYLLAGLRINTEFLGSDKNWQSIYLDARKYISFNGFKNRILCFKGLAWFIISGKPPYLDLPSTSTARGYDDGRYTGKNMLYFETEFRFNLMRNGLLGAVVFTNASAFPEANVDFALIPGFGSGLRLKINKDSRTNFGFDYAIGIRGSSGFYLTIGEVF